MCRCSSQLSCNNYQRNTKSFRSEYASGGLAQKDKHKQNRKKLPYIYISEKGERIFKAPPRKRLFDKVMVSGSLWCKVVFGKN